MVLDHMFQDHNLGAKSHSSKCRNPILAKSLENLHPAIFGIVFGETTAEVSMTHRVSVQDVTRQQYEIVILQVGPIPT